MTTPQRYSVEAIREKLRPFKAIGRGAHSVVLLTACGAILGLAAPFFRAAAHVKPASVPSAMEEVKWQNPESSMYCLACHHQVSPATAGLDVQRGHSLNVALNETQLRTVREMGTVAGPGGTLICMSCHKLGQDASAYMLADSLADSRLCRRCHQGHYAEGTPHDYATIGPFRKEPARPDGGRGRTVAARAICHTDTPATLFPRRSIPTGTASPVIRPTTWPPIAPAERCNIPNRTACNATTRMTCPTAASCESRPTNSACDAMPGWAAALAAGMHPLGRMDRAVPAALQPVGTAVGQEPHEVDLRDMPFDARR